MTGTRAEVVAEARTWLMTPYHHRARVRGSGVDCANLPAAVYEACGLAPHIDPEYSQQWMLHRDEEEFLNYVLPNAREIEFAAVKPGDLLVWKFYRTFSHSAIVIDLPIVIHSALVAGAVVEANIEIEAMFFDKGERRPVRCFTLWDD